MTVYDVCISDWSSDVCSADLHGVIVASAVVRQYRLLDPKSPIEVYAANPFGLTKNAAGKSFLKLDFKQAEKALEWMHSKGVRTRSEEHTSELQSLMRNPYAVFCLKKKRYTF